MTYILLVYAQNSLFFEITVCSVKYTNGPFKIQVFHFIHTKFVKIYTFSVKYQNNGKILLKIRCSFHGVFLFYHIKFWVFMHQYSHVCLWMLIKTLDLVINRPC